MVTRTTLSSYASYLRSARTSPSTGPVCSIQIAARSAEYYKVFRDPVLVVGEARTKRKHVVLHLSITVEAAFRRQLDILGAVSLLNRCPFITGPLTWGKIGRRSEKTSPITHGVLSSECPLNTGFAVQLNLSSGVTRNQGTLPQNCVLYCPCY